MFSFRRPKVTVRIDVPRLKPRGEASSAAKVELAELTPELLPYLGQASYLQLVFVDALAAVVRDAPDERRRMALAPTVTAASAKHAALSEEIRNHGADPTQIVAPFALTIDRFRDTVAGKTWHEQLASCLLCQGILDDFFILLAAGLNNVDSSRVTAILRHDSGRESISEILANAIVADPSLGSLLAMWGRRVVGDTLLIARSAVQHTDDAKRDEQQIEPVFTEVIAEHSRRMDALGLTA